MRNMNAIELVKENIKRVAMNAREDNWDGDGADGVSEETEYMALKLVDLLPSYTICHELEVDATPFGSIDFEWVLDDRLILNILVMHSRRIGYAYSVHGDRNNREEGWEGEGLPAFVSDAIDKVFHAS